MAVRKVKNARRRYATKTANPAPRKRKAVRRRKATAKAAPKRRRKRVVRANPAKRRVTRRKATRRTVRRANPARKATSVKRRRRRSSALAHPAKRRVTRRKATRRAIRRNPSHKRLTHRRRRNPTDKAIFKLAGIDMGAVAIGAAAALVLRQAVNNIGFIQEQVAKLPTWAQPVVGPGTAILGGWAIHKYVKNPMIKRVGMFTAAAGLVMLVVDLLAPKIKEWMPGSTSGAYHAFGASQRPKMSGAYHAFGGAYVALPKQLSGVSSYRPVAKSMFGGITNLA